MSLPSFLIYFFLAFCFFERIPECSAIDSQVEEQILSVAEHHACILEQTAKNDEAGEIVCWGENDEHELDSPEVSFCLVIVTV